MFRFFLASVVGMFFAGAAFALPQAVEQHIPNATVIGSGKITKIVGDVYEATLYAPSGTWQADRPFALSLHYFREVEGALIARRAVESMSQQGLTDKATQQDWQAQMENILPDMKNGSVLTAIYQPGQPTRFYEGETERGMISTPEFGTFFFNIWLGRDSKLPDLRRQLLGCEGSHPQKECQG